MSLMVTETSLLLYFQASGTSCSSQTSPKQGISCFCFVAHILEKELCIVASVDGVSAVTSLLWRDWQCQGDRSSRAWPLLGTAETHTTGGTEVLRRRCQYCPNDDMGIVVHDTNGEAMEAKDMMPHGFPMVVVHVGIIVWA